MTRRIQFLFVGLLLIGAFNAVSAHTRSPSPEYVDTLLPGYLSVQSALAEDDLTAAKTAARSLLKSVIRGPKNLSLSSSVSRISKARDLAHARQSFARVTSAILHLVEEVGTTGKLNLFLWECSQTEAGGRDIWLQSDQVARNPYHHKTAPNCPKIRRQLAHQKSLP